jgi:bacterioferritin (cytochrome b1)
MGEPAPLDVENVLKTLKRALSLQYRSALRYTLVAGSATGVEWQAMGEQLWRFAEEELDDARRLIEKIVALGGEPDAAPAELPYEASMEKAFSRLIDEEAEAVAALHAIIPHTGQEPRSEALEHRVEHLIMRKQEQLDTLRRALDRHAG